MLNEQPQFVQPVVKPVEQPVWQPAVYMIQPVVKPVVKRVWQPVECLYKTYTIQPVVNPVWQPVWQQVVPCKRGFTLPSDVGNQRRWTLQRIRSAKEWAWQHLADTELSLLFIMVALCNRADHYIFALWFLSSSSSSIFFFYSSPNLSGRRLDVYHTSTHGVALVRI